MISKIEEMIDEKGIETLAENIALICSEKADHIRENWQDENLAEKWDLLAGIYLEAGFRIRDARKKDPSFPVTKS